MRFSSPQPGCAERRQLDGELPVDQHNLLYCVACFLAALLKWRCFLTSYSYQSPVNETLELTGFLRGDSWRCFDLIIHPDGDIWPSWRLCSWRSPWLSRLFAAPYRLITSSIAFQHGDHPPEFLGNHLKQLLCFGVSKATAGNPALLFGILEELGDFLSMLSGSQVVLHGFLGAFLLSRVFFAELLPGDLLRRTGLIRDARSKSRTLTGILTHTSRACILGRASLLTGTP
jgi:hypothetical protein